MAEERREFFGHLISLVLPIALQSLLTSLVSASDAFMLGFLDQASLSAISLAAQITFVLSLFHAAYMIGAGALAAQYWGFRDGKTVEHVLGISLRFSLPTSAVFFLLARFFPVCLCVPLLPMPCLLLSARILCVSFPCLTLCPAFHRCF